MSDTAFPGWLLLILAGGLTGAWMLRRSWNLRQGSTGWRLGGWALLTATLVWPAFILGPAKGPFLALALIPVAALALVAASHELRAAKSPKAARESLAPEPADRPTTRWRTTLRWLLAGPIGMVAAMGVGICYAVWVPGEAQTRLLIGGLIVPVVWGACMAWTLADSRIVRATAVLLGTALVGFGLSILKGFA
ncbi:hypothetical protein [Sandaracinobacteroides hominis]|uniref:hypothetical protein n=1 Tax=Sandaracinobacteroides hominis TaxID=2780086 RepID=UPI0018F3B41B|nr:hypothetical protein [Sandaracinobacteroides hominis]